MAVSLISSTQNYSGTAAEMAAMATTSLKVGSKFIQSDTGLMYQWSGAAWFKLIFPAA